MRLEYRKGTSHKFWEITVAPPGYTVVFGRIGGTAQRKTTRCSAPTAEKAAAQLVRSKVKKGYKPVDAVVSRAKATPTGKPKPTDKPIAASVIRDLVKKLDRVTREYLITEDENPTDPKRYKLYPPASERDITTYERQLGRELPPSYRHFLKMHNGWLGYWGDSALLGVPKPYNANRHRYIKRDLRESDDYLDENDEGSDFYRAAEVVPISCDLNGGFVAFDMTRIDKRGEPEVLDCMHTNGCVDNRFKNFPAFLKLRISCAKKWIARNKAR